MTEIRHTILALNDAVNEFGVILRTLIEDVSKCRKMVNEENEKSFWRRAFVRSLFSCIEGINFRMKFVAVGLAGVNSIKLTRAENALLMEETYDVNHQGEAIVSKSKLKTAANLLFVLRITAQASKSNFEIDKSSENWYSFREALKIRDRITHPKNQAALIISDSELKLINKACNWYFACVADLGQLLQKNIKDLLKEEQSNKVIQPTGSKRRRVLRKRKITAPGG